MRRLAVGVVVSLLMLPAVTAYAQNPAQEAIDHDKKAQAEDAEKAYQRALKDRGPTPETKVDPWGTVRAADPPPQSKQNSKAK
jgi:hypothetical protein